MSSSNVNASGDALLRGFPPIRDRSARVLVLGSMPGVRSLEQQQYYAHPRNAFWTIMGDVVGAGQELPYQQRVAVLRRRGVAVWDVLAACQRPGSLDSRIRPESIETNDFQRLFESCPHIERIAFNGRVAEQYYLRRVLPSLKAPAAAIESLRLPSTSPAYAALSLERKIAAWRQALAPVLAS